jgi:hypothetical protein
MASGNGAHYHGGFSWAQDPRFGELTLDENGVELSAKRRKAKVPGATLVKVGIAAIASVEITSQEIAKSRAGAVLLFGVWGLAAKGARDQGTFLVHLKNGQTGYFTIDGFSESQLRGKISPWLNSMGIPQGVPAKSEIGHINASNPHGSIADELGKLAALRDSGVLTDEEFAAAKAKILG